MDLDFENIHWFEIQDHKFVIRFYLSLLHTYDKHVVLIANHRSGPVPVTCVWVGGSMSITTIWILSAQACAGKNICTPHNTSLYLRLRVCISYMSFSYFWNCLLACITNWSCSMSKSFLCACLPGSNDGSKQISNFLKGIGILERYLEWNPCNLLVALGGEKLYYTLNFEQFNVCEKCMEFTWFFSDQGFRVQNMKTWTMPIMNNGYFACLLW